MAGFVDKVTNATVEFVLGVKFIASWPRNLLQIKKMIQKPSYYPELERKTSKEMWMDNISWMIKRQEFNKFYLSYGMDAKDFRNPDDFLSYKEFRELRNKGNRFPSNYGEYSYIALLRDKYLFATYLSATIGGQYVVPVKALIRQNRAFFLETNQWTDVNKLLENDSELVYKVIDGECADGVMLVSVSGDKVVADDIAYSKDQFVDTLRNKTLIVQDVAKQHPQLNKFGTRSVNTIRAVTVKGKSGEVNMLSAFLRLGASADSFVDNRAVGGLGIGIDLGSGKLMKYGFPHDAFGIRTETHPLSGVRFEDFEIPYWKEAVQLVKDAHKQFYDIQSIGWDVIITPDGPVLLEGNDNWEIGGPQDTMGGLKKKWFELVNA